MDKLSALKAFVEVARGGGFSKAARNLGVATSSLTRLVDALEQEIGTALLTRSTRQCTLTDSGKAYFDQVTRLLADLEEADASVSDRGAGAAGPLRVTVPSAIGRLCIGPRLPEFLARHPKLTLHLDLSDARVDLAEQRFDVAVRIGACDSDVNLVVRGLGPHPRVLVASAEYLTAHGTPTTPDELVDHRCLRFSYGTDDQRWYFRGPDGARHHAPVDGPLTINSVEVLREVALHHGGIALLPMWLVRQDLRDGRLRALLPNWQVQPSRGDVGVYAAYLPNRRRSARVAAFIEFVERCLTDLEVFTLTSTLPLAGLVTVAPHAPPRCEPDGFPAADVRPTLRSSPNPGASPWTRSTAPTDS